MGCIKFIVKKGDITYQIKLDNGVLTILDKDGNEFRQSPFDEKEKKIIEAIQTSLKDIKEKINDDRLLYNYFFNVLNKSLSSDKIKKQEEKNGDITYTINSSIEEINKIFEDIFNNLNDIEDVKEDILRHYSASYRAKVLGHSDAEIIDNTYEGEADILRSINSAKEKIYELTSENFNKTSLTGKELLKTIQQDFNNRLNDFIKRYDNLAQKGGLFNVQLYSQLFNLNENLDYVQTLLILESNYKSLVNAFNTYVSIPYDTLRNRGVELPDIEEYIKEENKNEKKENKKEKKEPKKITIENFIANLYLAVNQIKDENAKFYQDSIEKLFEVFDSLDIKDLIKCLHSLHEHIKLIENLHSLIKSDRQGITEYLSNLSSKELSYVEEEGGEIGLRIKALQDSILANNANNKSLEILNSLSILYVNIVSLRTNYEYFKKNKEGENKDFTAAELQQIIELSNTSNISKDVTFFNKFFTQFDSTNIAEIISLKTLFNLHDIRLKERNRKDLDEIKDKYNDFLKKFGSYDAMEKAMNSLFERDKTKSVRTGYLISKYDNKKLVEKDDAFRTSNMNGDLYELYKFIKENTTYGSLIEKINIVPSIFDLLGFEYVDGTEGKNNFNKRDSVYNDVVYKYSMIRYEGDANKQIKENSFNGNLKLKNPEKKLEKYLDDIKKKLDDYLNELSNIKDENGNRVISDEYIEFMRLMIDNNHKQLKSYFDDKINAKVDEEEVGFNLEDLTYNDIAVIANSYMTLLDRFDIGTYFMYMNDVYNDIEKSLEEIRENKSSNENKKKLEETKLRTQKSDFAKIYKLSQALKYNNLNYKETSKILSEEYQDYINENKGIDRNILDEFYEYFYETFLKLNKDVGDIDMYSRIGNKVFVGEAEKSYDEKIRDGGVWETFKEDYLSRLVNDNAYITYQIYDDDPTMIRNLPVKRSLTLTEENMSKNLFLNLINFTMERNKYEMGEELIMDGKSYIMSISGNAVVSGTNITRPYNLLSKIKNEIEAKLGYNKRKLFLNEIPVLNKSGIEKIEKRLLTDKEQLINSNISKFYESMMDTVNRFYKNRSSIYDKLKKYGIDINQPKVSEEKVTHIEFSAFLMALYSEVENNPILMENVVEHNKVLNSIILHIIAQNKFWLGQLRAAFDRISSYEDEKKKYLKGKDTSKMDDDEFLYFITNEVKTLDFILIYDAILGRSDLYYEDAPFDNPLKKLIHPEEGKPVENIYTNIPKKSELIFYFSKGVDTEKLLDINDDKYKDNDLIKKFKEIEAENREKLDNLEDDEVTLYELYTTPITIGDLKRILRNMFKVTNTDVVQTKKTIEQEIKRVEWEKKTFSIERMLDTLTEQTASTVLSWNLGTFVAELAYGTISFFNLGLSSRHFSLVQVLKAMFKGYAHTMKSSMYADKKIEKIQQILNSDEMIRKIGYDHPYYRDMEIRNNIDVWLKRYKDFKNIVNHIPSSIHKNTALFLACEYVYVDIVENGQKKRINILDCFDDDGEMIYPVDDYVIAKLMSVYTQILKENTLYNNGNVELNRTIYRHLTLFKSFLFNMFDNYFHNDTYSRAFNEYHRGIYQSLFGKGSLFLNNQGRFSLFRTISLLPCIITGDASELKYKSDINNIRRFGIHILTLVAIYLAIETLAGDIYEEEEYGFYDEEGNYVRGKRRRRLKGAEKSKKYLYSLLTRIYRENMLMYDANSTVSLFGQLGIPQVGYLSNMYEFVAHTLSGEVYTTGVYKGESKAKIDFMQMFPITNAVLRTQNLENQANKQY